MENLNELDSRLDFRESNQLLSNLGITTTLGTQNLLPLLTGGRCSVVALYYENWNRDPEIVVAVGKWSLFGGGR